MESQPAMQPAIALDPDRRGFARNWATAALRAWRANFLPPSDRSAWYCLAAAALSGVLLWMCYFPLALGAYFGWIAIVPFLVLVRSRLKPRFLYDCSWVCGMVFFFPALSWMRVADLRMHALWVMLTVYCSLYFPLALYLLRLLDSRRIPLVLSVPLVWAAQEYLRAFLITGFPWYFLAHTQHEVLPIIQMADLGGVFLISFLVAAVNAFLFDCASQFAEVRRWFQLDELEPYRNYASLELLNRGFFARFQIRRNLILEGLAVAALFVGAWIYGECRLGQEQCKTGPMVCLLQSNLDQRIRNQAETRGNDTSPDAMSREFDRLCGLASRMFPQPDLIIWPETSFPYGWYGIASDVEPSQIPADWLKASNVMIGELHKHGVKHNHIPQLIGMNVKQLEKDLHARRYNSAMLFNEYGSAVARFDKMHRLPFGEYVPFKDWLPLMDRLSPYDFDYSIQQGKHFTRFKVNKYHFGVLICYEDSDPFLARRYLETGPDGGPVDFLVNISNDGWFDGSAEHEEHLVVSRFRAIECRRALVRSVNMGVSALIDSSGRVLKPIEHAAGKVHVWEVRGGQTQSLPPGDWHDFKQVSGVLAATIPIDDRFSFYTVAGDWLPIGCWLVLAAAAVWPRLKRRRSAVAVPI
jgi:apolipoprotein N-acyltransferase